MSQRALTDSKMGTDSKPGVFVKTFGCQMNEYDSEKMLALLSAEYRPVQNLEDAKVVIVNTCSVREKAESKLFDLLGILRDLKKERPELVVGVGGCVAQQEGKKILSRNRAVDFIVGTHNLSLIPRLVEAARNGAEPQVAVDYREDWEDLPAEFDSLPRVAEFERGEPTATFGTYYSPVRALIAIQRGCNKNCSYCVVPHTRGPEVSRAPEEIEREIRTKVRMGAREVMLLGQTVNSYGRDLTPRSSFTELVRRVAAIEGVHRIRFTSPHPAEVRPDFISLYGEIPALMPHIHLPVQSGNDRVLRLMNRNYRIRRYREIIEQLRELVPHIAISTDVIVGFPTETDAEFQETLALVEEVRYHHIFAFKYSRRPHTAAVDSYGLSEEVPSEVSQRRLEELVTTQKAISGEINRSLLGTQVEVLVEGLRKQISSGARGRTAHNTPAEISGSVKLGDLVWGMVEHASPHGLRVQVGTVSVSTEANVRAE